MSDNAKTIQEIYEAFGRGDVPAILSRMADNTEWDFSVGKDDVPWHVPARGKGEVPRFFQDFGGNVSLGAFEPGEFVVSGRHVIVPVHLRYTVRRTGKVVDMNQVQWWTFDDTGKVSRLRHFEDTAQVLKAWTA